MKPKLSKDSLCKRCEYLEKEGGGYCCIAFPPFAPFNGIPVKYLSGQAEHLQTDKGQDIDAYFKDKNLYPKL